MQSKTKGALMALLLGEALDLRIALEVGMGGVQRQPSDQRRGGHRVWFELTADFAAVAASDGSVVRGVRAGVAGVAARRRPTARPA